MTGPFAEWDEMLRAKLGRNEPGFSDAACHFMLKEIRNARQRGDELRFYCARESLGDSVA